VLLRFWIKKRRLQQLNLQDSKKSYEVKKVPTLLLRRWERDLLILCPAEEFIGDAPYEEKITNNSSVKYILQAFARTENRYLKL
jgi:hypothetical protein